MLIHEIMPVLQRAADHKFRQSLELRVSIIGDKGRWRHHAPRRVAHADQRFGAARRERMHVDFLLIPQLQPAGLQRLRHIDRRARRRLLRKQRDHTGPQAIRTERRGKRRQHRNSDLLPELAERVHDDRLFWTDQQHLAVEFLVDKDFQDVSGLNAVIRYSEKNEIGRVQVQQQGQLVGARALGGNEAQLFKSLREKRADVSLRVDDANARCNLALAECRDRIQFRGLETPHTSPPCPQRRKS